MPRSCPVDRGSCRRRSQSGRRELQIAVLARVFEDCSDTEAPQVDERLRRLLDQTPAAATDEAMDRAGMPFAPV
ncbi:hypothetical protein [Tistlia consotensis]|uniref:hypothetical protein n=1 Tax=Tistlia consotensis TaxID=1321365 RepID=UPI00117CDED3|nr:hypothetical protein [Tistlia consotensis]